MQLYTTVNFNKLFSACQYIVALNFLLFTIHISINYFKMVDIELM